MTDYDKIRKFENEILDQHYTKLEFYQYSDDVVIPYLLQSFGDTERHSPALISHGRTEAQVSFFLNNMIHGISHCIRWIKKQEQPTHLTISDYGKAHRLSMDFITWGIDYNNIAQEFIIWSRKFKTAILHEGDKKITFISPDDLDYSKVFGNQVLHWQQYDEPFNDELSEIIQKEFQKWAECVNLNDPPILNHVKWALAKTSPVYPPFYAHMEKLIFPELSPETDLGGYSLQQLRQFYTLFYINFYFIYTIELSIDEKQGAEHSFGSNPLYLSVEKFINLAILVTDLSREVVIALINDFTFDHSEFNARISIQPFIQSNLGTYYILPNLFIQVHPARMMTGILNTNAKRKIYEKLINQIEKTSLLKLEEVIKVNTALKYFIEKTIKYKGKQYQPDIIIIDESASAILVVEYKHYIAPIMAAEVVNRVKELHKALKRLEEYKEAVMATNQISGINLSNYSISGLLLTHRPLPIPLPLKLTSIITDSISFANILAEHDSQQTLKDFIIVLSRKEEELSIVGFTDNIEDIGVDGWTIQRTIRKKYAKDGTIK